MKAARPLAQHLDSPTDEARISRMWGVIRQRRHGRAAPTWLLVPTLGLAATAALFAIYWPAPRVESDAASPTTFEVPARFGTTDARRTFDLPDGSRIELARESSLTTIQSDDTRFVTLLERGTARFEVRPGGPRRWVIESGLATVEVVGTVFEVEREATRVRVSVERGVVLVRGERVPDRVARLTRGDELIVHADPIAMATEVAAASTSGVVPETEMGPEAEAEPLVNSGTETGTRTEQFVTSSARSGRSPRRRTNSGTETRARQGPESTGPRTETRIGTGTRTRTETRPATRAETQTSETETDIADLLRRASSLRREGDSRRAAALLRLASAEGDDARAALAAFTLGRIEMDELDHPGRARTALRRALALGLPERIAQQARARLERLDAPR